MQKGKKRRNGLRNLILFNSHLYTVKSVYLQKDKDGVIIHLDFEEEGSHKVTFLVREDEIDQLQFLKKGVLITVHIGNGGYVCVEEGTHLPEEGYIFGCVIDE